MNLKYFCYMYTRPQPAGGGEWEGQRREGAVVPPHRIFQIYLNSQGKWPSSDIFVQSTKCLPPRRNPQATTLVHVLYIYLVKIGSNNSIQYPLAVCAVHHHKGQHLQINLFLNTIYNLQMHTINLLFLIHNVLITLKILRSDWSDDTKKPSV